MSTGRYDVTSCLVWSYVPSRGSGMVLRGVWSLGRGGMVLRGGGMVL